MLFAWNFERASDHFGMDLAQHFGIVFKHFAVVGEKSVDLDLDVGRLRVDRTAKPLRREIAELSHEPEIRLLQPLARLGVLDSAVAPIAVGLFAERNFALIKETPDVPLDRMPEPAELAEERDAAFRRGRRARLRGRSCLVCRCPRSA